MRLSVRSQPIIKSVCYSILSLAAICFSASFFPALGISVGTPHLAVAIVSALAMTEGITYASFAAVALGAAEAFIYGENPLAYVLFYTAFAFLCMLLFGSFFTKSFFSWGLYTLGGILLHAALGLFRPVSDWNISAAEMFPYGTLQSILWSVLFSLAIYPAVSLIKRKTE